MADDRFSLLKKIIEAPSPWYADALSSPREIINEQMRM